MRSPAACSWRPAAPVRLTTSAQSVTGRSGNIGYHATAVETGAHLARCLTYIDLNMVRAGVVDHPAHRRSGGYHEIQTAPARYRIINRAALAEVLGVESMARLAQTHAEWIEAALAERVHRRHQRGSASVAIGSRAFVERMADKLGDRARYREDPNRRLHRRAARPAHCAQLHHSAPGMVSLSAK